jgi:Uma2 family endonuclease
MATAATDLMTAEQFYEFVHRPENRDRIFELEDGEIVEMSRPGKKHGLVCANVSGILREYAKAKKRGYVCSNDTGIVVARDPDRVRGPDVMYFEDAKVFDEVGERFAETPPLLAVEVLSPNDKFGMVNRRIQDQLRFGARLVWLLDPESMTVTIYRPEKQHHVLDDSEELTGDDVLTDFRCKVAEFFMLPGQ